MDKKHLPYNILLCLTVLAVALMAVYNLALRDSGFAVRVGYQIPAPPISQQAAPSQADAAAPPATPAQAPEEAGEPQTVVVARFPLELNAATLEELKLIPGVGEVLGQRMVQYRELLGGYSELSQLLEIKGIGEATYQKITAYLYLEQEPDSAEEDPAEGEEILSESDED